MHKEKDTKGNYKTTFSEKLVKIIYIYHAWWHRPITPVLRDDQEFKNIQGWGTGYRETETADPSA